MPTTPLDCPLPASACVTVEGGQTAAYNLEGVLLCPYHNRWGESAYRLSGPFEHHPLRIHASSTSGSPVIEDQAGRFFGLLGFEWDQADDIAFRYDGRGRLTVHNHGDRPIEVFSGDTPAAPGEHWRRYNAILSTRLARREQEPAFWGQLEYCTWVEQKHEARRAGGDATPHTVLNDDFIDRYLQQIDRLNLPKGKLTIDHGWQHGDETYGDWDPHPQRFPDLGRTAERIRNAGFVPGIWLAPIWLHPATRVARAQPQLLGPTIAPSNADSPLNDVWHYWTPGDELAQRMQDVFGYLYQLGFRKFKLDMIYARKDFMVALQAVIYNAVKAVAPDAEVETHHPDPFFGQYTDTVRTNDVLCNNRQQWRQLTRDHFMVCEQSAFDHIINLDHIGGNDPAVTSADYMEHLGFYRDATGHPVVSLLPHHAGIAAVEAVRELLTRHTLSPRARSRFR